MKLPDALKPVLVALIKVALLQRMSNLGNVAQLELLHHGRSEMTTVEDTIHAMLDLPRLQVLPHRGLRNVKETIVVEVITTAVKTRMAATTELHLETQPLGNNTTLLLLLLQHIQTEAILLLAMAMVIPHNRQWVLHLALLPD